MSRPPHDVTRLGRAANLLWSWLCQPRRGWALETECLHALSRFRTFAPPLSDEEARAAMTVGVLQNLIAIDDEKAHSLYYTSMGHEPVDGAVIVRAKTQNG